MRWEIPRPIVLKPTPLKSRHGRLRLRIARSPRQRRAGITTVPVGPVGDDRLDASLHRRVVCRAQIIGVLIFVLFRSVTTGSLKVDDIGTNGNILAFATLLSTLATVGLVGSLLGSAAIPSAITSHFTGQPVRSVVIALLGLAIVLVATDLTSYLLGRPLVPTVMVDIYRTAWLPGLVFAFVVLAPAGRGDSVSGISLQGYRRLASRANRRNNRQHGRLCLVARAIRLVWGRRSRGDRALSGPRPVPARSLS